MDVFEHDRIFLPATGQIDLAGERANCASRGEGIDNDLPVDAQTHAAVGPVVEQVRVTIDVLRRIYADFALDADDAVKRGGIGILAVQLDASAGDVRLHRDIGLEWPDVARGGGGEALRIGHLQDDAI